MRWGRPLWTIFLVVFITAVFFVQDFLPMDDLMFTPAYAFQKPWTFVTPIFLHADISHLFFNMFALFFFGLSLESKIGRNGFLLIFFLSGIAGSLLYMLTTDNPLIPALGASGSVFGLIGTLAVIAPLSIVYVYYAPMPLIVAAVLWALTEFLGLFSPGSGIARGAHLGGLFLGVAYGFYLRRKFGIHGMQKE